MIAKIKLSVRELVEFVLRSGSIDNRFQGTDRAAEGSRIHRRLQKAGGNDYNAEVSLKAQREINDVLYLLDGRADGIFTENGETIIDEIKTTTALPEQLTADFSAVHWAQAECYGAMYCEAQELNDITLQLTYFVIDTQDIIRHRKHYTRTELESKMRNYLLLYEPFAIMTANHSINRKKSISNLNFPFENYRNGQYELARAVYMTIKKNERLAAIAPTGIGKTISTLFPAIKAMGEDKIDRIFYLTSKTVTRKAANDAICILKSQQKADIKSLTLTAKDKICLLSERECTPLACPYAKNYYDKINNILLELLNKYDDFTSEILTTFAQNYEICPFELALDLSNFCDIIVCDYNYLFDPVVKLQRFFDKDNGDYVFLIDEAHNLGDRARDMYSAKITKVEFYEMKKALCKSGKKLNASLRAINSYFISLRHLYSDERNIVKIELDDNLSRILADFNAQCAIWLDDNKQNALHKKMLDLYFKSRFYTRICEVYDEHFITEYEISKTDISITLDCLDACEFIDSSLKLGKSAILFSATLYPLEYYKKTLGLGECKRIVLDSPFDTSHLCLASCVNISTKYNDRADTLDEICNVINTAINAKQGNYIVYFPSYKYLDNVSERYTQMFNDANVLIQKSSMSEDERDIFLNSFKANSDNFLLGFCVLGGIFSEGIDLSGDKLIGSIIVGVGLPQISYKQ
ncbi:MAG: helicase C-terminal domain-containing protein, partial [Oscillospiraceae bacterium]